jgi:hypothetical protein
MSSPSFSGVPSAGGTVVLACHHQLLTAGIIHTLASAGWTVTGVGTTAGQARELVAASGRTCASCSSPFRTTPPSSWSRSPRCRTGRAWCACRPTPPWTTRRQSSGSSRLAPTAGSPSTCRRRCSAGRSTPCRPERLALSRRHVRMLLSDLRRPSEGSVQIAGGAAVELTPRQQEVLAGMARAGSTQSIATALGISPGHRPVARRRAAAQVRGGLARGAGRPAAEVHPRPLRPPLPPLTRQRGRLQGPTRSVGPAPTHSGPVAARKGHARSDGPRSPWPETAASRGALLCGGIMILRSLSARRRATAPGHWSPRVLTALVSGTLSLAAPPAGAQQTTTGCSPYSTLSCDRLAVAPPVGIDWTQPQGGLGSGGRRDGRAAPASRCCSRRPSAPGSRPHGGGPGDRHAQHHVDGRHRLQGARRHPW